MPTLLHLHIRRGGSLARTHSRLTTRLRASDGHCRLQDIAPDGVNHFLTSPLINDIRLEGAQLQEMEVKKVGRSQSKIAQFH
ncbi:hypothetical protein EJB05_12865 [Eragrostis curvula]|uniref:Uncharacterized protein n=1 Tax=Eragrostis curvula TaxID=38414 RepID=A0A5J9VV31_9POAL|nr:hypothetical protein EJB05_12865 [Eragrostis curvula]